MEIPERGKDGIIIRTAAFADSDWHRFRGKGFTFSLTGTSVAYIPITENISFNGVVFILKGHVFGDTISATVIDKDNILGYGEGLVLDPFLSSWGVADDMQTQSPIILPYKANLKAGLYFKLDYSKITEHDVLGCVNLFRHIKETV